MLNNVSLIGRLTQAPELKTTSNDNSVVNFCLAVTRSKTSSGEWVTDFIDCVAWGKTAEFINQYFTKGQLMALKGSIQTRIYVDKEDKKRKIVEILVDNVYFIEPKKLQQEQNHNENNEEYNKFNNMQYDSDLPF